MQSADALNAGRRRRPTVHLERIAGETIGVLTLDDPKRSNAMTLEMGDAFTLALRKVQNDKNLRALIIRGAGENFSVGGDREMLLRLGDGSRSEAELRNFVLGFYNRWLPILDIPVPVITVLHGACIEVAAMFACAADIVVTDETLNLRVRFASLGLYPGLAIPELLSRKVGSSRAALLLMGEESVSGREAERLGLVERCVPAGTAFEEATRIATRIAEASPTTIRTFKKNRRLLLSDISAELELDAAQQARDFRSGDHRARVAGRDPDSDKQTASSSDDVTKRRQ